MVKKGKASRKIRTVQVNALLRPKELCPISVSEISRVPIPQRSQETWQAQEENQQQMVVVSSAAPLTHSADIKREQVPNQHPVNPQPQPNSQPYRANPLCISTSSGRLPIPLAAYCPSPNGEIARGSWWSWYGDAGIAGEASYRSSDCM